MQGSTLTIQPIETQSILQLNGNGGEPLFSIKPNGEFVPGPKIQEGEALNEFSKFIYKSITIFGKSISQTLDERNQRIAELEKEIERLKANHGT